MGSNYIRAGAFGFPRAGRFYRCALKNALVPVVGVFGLMVGYTIAGTVFVEVIFTRPGLGTWSLNAITERSWPIIRAAVLVYAAFFVAGNLVSDLSYRFLDPRIRVEEGVETLG